MSKASKEAVKNLPKFEEYPDRQDKIDLARAAIVGFDTGDLAREFARQRGIKKQLEDSISSISIVMEACSQLLVEQLGGQDIQKITLETGETVYLQSEPYPVQTDRGQLRSWIKEQGMEELLTLNYQTLAALVKERLNDGLEPPPGVSVSLKTRARCRGGNS